MAQQRFQAGMLDRVGALQSKSTIRDDRNERTNTWDTVKAAIPCHRKDMQGVENDTETERQTAFGRVRWIVRYLPEAKPSMRFVVEGVVYDIRAISEPEGTRRQWTILDCQSRD